MNPPLLACSCHYCGSTLRFPCCYFLTAVAKCKIKCGGGGGDTGPLSINNEMN